MTNSLSQARIVAYAFAADTPGNVGHLYTFPYPGDNKFMRAGKGNLFVGFRCKLPRRGGSAVYLALLFVGRTVQSEILRSAALRMTGWQAGRREKDFFYRNDAGMSLKTKDRRGKSGDEAGMSLITKEIGAESWNIIENKGDNRYEKSQWAWRNILQS